MNQAVKSPRPCYAASFLSAAGRPVPPLSFSLGVDRCHSHWGGSRHRRMAARIPKQVTAEKESRSPTRVFQPWLPFSQSCGHPPQPIKIATKASARSTDKLRNKRLVRIRNRSTRNPIATMPATRRKSKPAAVSDILDPINPRTLSGQPVPSATLSLPAMIASRKIYFYRCQR